jgi:thiamine biosynthesis lipoprotein
MGSTASLAIPSAGSANRVEPLVAEVRALLAELEERFSPFLPDSELNRLREGRLTEDEPSELMREVVSAVAALQGTTAGAFHPFDRLGRFDPTGYVKGWAIEQAMGLLIAAGVTDASLGIGGDLQTIGRSGTTRARGRQWRVAIVDPMDPAHVVAIVAAPGPGPFAVATSGNAQRGEHIWPAPIVTSTPTVHAQGPARDATPRPAARGPASITVIGPELRLADAFATAIWSGALSGGLDDAWAWLGGTGYEALAVGVRGTIRATPGMAELLVRPAA